MEIQNVTFDGITQAPPSPGFSDLLANLLTGDTDDSGCTKPDGAVPSSTPPTAHDPMDVAAPSAPLGSAAPSNGLAPNTVLSQSIFNAFAQRLGPLSADLQLALLLGQTGGAQQATIFAPGSHKQEPTAAAGQPTFASVSKSGPRASSGSGGPAAGGGSRRGRRALPRLTDLQQQLDCLTQQFQVLSQENSFLRGKLKLLEHVLPYRDSHIGFLAAVKNGQPAPGTGPYIPTPASPDAAAVAPPQPSAAALAAPVAVAEAAAAAGTSGSSFSSGSVFPASLVPSLAVPGAAASGAAAAAARAGLSAATAVPMAAAGATAIGAYGDLSQQAAGGGNPGRGTGGADGGAGRVQAGAGDQDGPARPMGHMGCGAALAAPTTAAPIAAAAAGCWSTAPPVHLPGTPAFLSLCPGPDGEVPTITPAAVEELKRVPPRDFQILYKHIVMQLSVLCPAAEVHGPASAQHARLERFLERAFVYLDQVVLLSPECFMSSMYINIETGQPERPPEEFWRAVARGLQLTSKQVDEIRMCSAVHTASITPVAQERVKLATELSATISAAVGQTAVSSGDAIKTLCEVDEVAERLRRNVIKERQVQMDVGDFLCVGVLTPVQVARCMAACYPYVPDVLAILHACDSLGAQAGGVEGAHGSQQGAGC